MAVFADLDLRAGSDLKSLRGLVETAAHLGYSVVAINHVVDFKEKKQEIEKPIAVSELFTTLPIVQGKSRPIKILTRVTIIVSDPSHCNVLPGYFKRFMENGIESLLLIQKKFEIHAFGEFFPKFMKRATSSRVRLYDIVAVFPKTEKLFHVACTQLDVDLVCITMMEKLPFYFRRPPISVAIDRGLSFELVYSPAIKDSTVRRYTISNALSLMQICRGMNVIISSAAERPLEIRGPYDVANLGLLFGFTENNAKAAVSANCRAALRHAETRKTAFGIISTVKKPRPSEGDDDSLPAYKKAKCEG